MRDAAVDVGARAVGLAHGLAAAERVRPLDADDHRELPALDHAARLRGRVDQAEPAPPAPAVLRIDVVLKPAQPVDLELDRLGLVARMRTARLDVAQRCVLDRLRDDHAQPGEPRALEPAVVGLLMRVGVVDGPACERGPPVRVVRAGRTARAQQVARFAGDDARLGERQRLAVVALQKRLVIKGVDLRRPSVHEQKEDALRPRRKV